jgi:hypothetical protein
MLLYKSRKLNLVLEFTYSSERKIQGIKTGNIYFNLF